jgi:hypothetical protein
MTRVARSDRDSAEAPLSDGPIADVREEGRRVVAAAQAADASARLLGGVAVGLHVHGAMPEGLGRAYADLDFIVRSKHDTKFKDVLTALGYEPDALFNRLHGYHRLLFYDATNDRQLDVFIGSFKMCHALDLNGRLDLDPLTLSPADLLLTKLQIVELNPKDVVDALTLLDQHAFGDETAVDAIDLRRVGEVTGSDWGWYTTIRDNLETLKVRAGGLVGPASGPAVADKMTELTEALERAPKSTRWRLRSVTGRRVPWYDLPEERIR